jgi:hypothetical protein
MFDIRLNKCILRKERLSRSPLTLLSCIPLRFFNTYNLIYINQFYKCLQKGMRKS